MAVEAVLTESFRKRIATHLAGGATLPIVKYMAFGDGGHNPDDDSAIPPSEAQTALKHEVLRKELTTVSQDDEFSVTGKGTILGSELQGVTLSEAALVDAEGNLIGIKNFAPKVKEADERYDISITIRL